MAFAAATALTSCNDDQSYADLLTKENQSTNVFLADQRVINEIPTDTNFVFQTGPDAPYYRLDEDGNLYMQVIDPGTRGNYAKQDEMIYFRYTRWNLETYAKTGDLGEGNGNESNMSSDNTFFRYQNFTLNSSRQWGTGIQMPLKYVGYYGRVNLVVKSQYGLTSEISQVIPYLYDITYLPSVSD